MHDYAVIIGISLDYMHVLSSKVIKAPCTQGRMLLEEIFSLRIRISIYNNFEGLHINNARMHVLFNADECSLLQIVHMPASDNACSVQNKMLK